MTRKCSVKDCDRGVFVARTNYCSIHYEEAIEQNLKTLIRTIKETDQRKSQQP